MAVPLMYVDRSTVGNHEVFEDTDQELQDVVILGLQGASSFGSASSWQTREGSLMASVSAP